MPESQYGITASISVGEQNASFVAWTSATAVNTVATLVNNDISYNTLNISLNQTTTITGGVVTFQGSFDGVNFFNLQGVNPGTQGIVGPTYTLQASTYATFQFNLTAIPYFQVLLSTAITGTGTVTIGYSADSFVSSNVAVTGTVAVTQSTSPWVVAGNLTNNNAAPTATLIGVLGAIAETAYTTVTYTTGDMVLPVTDLHGALNHDLQAVAGSAVSTAAAGVQKVGIVGNAGSTLDAGVLVNTAPTNGIAVLGVFPSVTPGLSGGQSVALQVDASGRLNVDIQMYAGAQLTGTVTAYGTAPTGNVFGVNSFITNTVTVAGNKTNNNAAPGATNIGALVAIVAPTNTTFPTYTAGDEVLLVTDLAGNTNTDMQYWAGSDLGAPSNYGTSPGAVVVPGVNAFVTNTVVVDGTLTNNNAAPTATLIGVLPAIAETTWTTVTYTTGDMVLPITDLHGALWSDIGAVAGNSVTTAGNGRMQVGVTGNIGGIFDAVTGAAVPANALQMGASDGTDLQALNTNVKGTQGARGLAVQELKDSGRTYVIFVVNNVALVGTEALQTMQINKGGTTTTGTSYTVTTGKTLRLQSFSIGLESTGGVQTVLGRIRATAAGGTVSATSSMLCLIACSNPSTAGSATGGAQEQSFPDGIELAATAELGITQVANGTAGTFVATLVGYEY
jgi:hypothetical protein